MIDKRCPPEAELLRFVDADLPPERLTRIEKHLELCSACAKQVMALSALIADIAAPLPFEQPLEIAPHVAGIMKRLDTPVVAPRGRWLLGWGSALAAAAAAVLLLTKLHGPAPWGAQGHEGEFAARGGPALATLARNVGVQVYGQESHLLALRSGSVITTKTPLTAGLRNVGKEPAYLLLFVVDAQREVHWIAPEYTSAGSNPQALPIAPASDERLLPSAAVFDDLAPGALRVVWLLSKTPLHVADIEALAADQLEEPAMRRRFPEVEVRELLLEAR